MSPYNYGHYKKGFHNFSRLPSHAQAPSYPMPASSPAFIASLKSGECLSSCCQKSTGGGEGWELAYIGYPMP